MELAPYVILTILSLLICGPYIRNGYDVPKRLLVTVVGVLSLVWWWHTGASSSMPEHVVWMTAGMLGWWFLCTLLSSYHTLALNEFAQHAGIVLFAAFGFGELSNAGLGIVMIGVVANCVFAIVQGAFKYEPFKSSSNYIMKHPIGFVGNTNMMGSFLVVSFFLSLYLATFCAWWLWVSLIIGYVVWMTKCRGSYIAIGAGGLVALWTSSSNVFDFIILALSGLSIMVMVNRRFVFDKLTGGERLQYWRIGWEQVKKTPVFGLGLCCLKVRVPYLQRELNRKTNGEFLNPEKYVLPFPQRVHSDYIQMVCDVGLPGLGVYVGLLIVALMSPVDVLIKASLIAGMVSGIFLHNLHCLPVNIWMWFVLFICLRSYGDVTIISVPWYVIAITVCVLLVGFRLMWKEAVCGYYFQKFARKHDHTALEEGLKWSKHDGFSLVYLGGAYQSMGRHWEAYLATMKGIEHYDGAIRYWELLTNAAKSCLTLGSLKMAELYAGTALSFYPHFKDAQDLLQQVTNVLAKMGIKNEPTLNVAQHQGIRTSAVDASSQAEDKRKI